MLNNPIMIRFFFPEVIFLPGLSVESEHAHCSVLGRRLVVAVEGGLTGFDLTGDARERWEGF